jgi:hypothetical protein
MTVGTRLAVSVWLSTVATLAGSAPATVSAQDVPKPLPAEQFTVTANYHRYDAINDALIAGLGTVSVPSVMANANRDRSPVTDSLGLAGYAGGFTFDRGDVRDCANYPQGITTSRDAVGTAGGGTYNGHQLVLVSWYTRDGCDGGHSRSRITLVDWDATFPDRYRKILLVEPTGSAAAPGFTDIAIHAGGVVWYGDYLYVAQTGSGMRVFDLRKILATEIGGAAGQIGRQPDGTYRAHNYAYVLPQIGTVTAVTASGAPLVWSTISLDRVSHSIVMTEYTCRSGCTAYPNRASRAVRFPFAPGATTFAATTASTQALQLPWFRLNGVASHNGRWWFNSSGDRRLYYWEPDVGPRSFDWVGGGESISYWEDTTGPDLLWSVQEPVEHRNVFAVRQASYS